MKHRRRTPRRRILTIPGQCVFLYFLKPLFWNRYGPGVFSEAVQGARTHELDRQSATSSCSPFNNLGWLDPHHPSDDDVTMSLALLYLFERTHNYLVDKQGLCPVAELSERS